ncbi:MAG TPA: hypothetical protein PLV33_03575 [Opitutaceae bacterium]|jgi:hypothetical protein|nr:hypothetical protein [Opitutaceae bacterium]HOR26063.1 hypothetical protein [Opitutaceae bacterium]HPK48437.1 hypothetical protein [Opitutaceae bacterium]
MTDLEKKLHDKMVSIPFEYVPAVPKSDWPRYAQVWAEGQMQSLYETWINDLKRKKQEIPPHDPDTQKIELFLKKPYSTILILEDPNKRTEA